MQKRQSDYEYEQFEILPEIKRRKRKVQTEHERKHISYKSLFELYVRLNEYVPSVSHIKCSVSFFVIKRRRSGGYQKEDIYETQQPQPAVSNNDEGKGFTMANQS